VLSMSEEVAVLPALLSFLLVAIEVSLVGSTLQLAVNDFWLVGFPLGELGVSMESLGGLPPVLPIVVSPVAIVILEVVDWLVATVLESHGLVVSLVMVVLLVMPFVVVFLLMLSSSLLLDLFLMLLFSVVVLGLTLESLLKLLLFVDEGLFLLLILLFLLSMLLPSVVSLGLVLQRLIELLLLIDEVVDLLLLLDGLLSVQGLAIVGLVVRNPLLGLLLVLLLHILHLFTPFLDLLEGLVEVVALDDARLGMSNGSVLPLGWVLEPAHLLHELLLLADSEALVGVGHLRPFPFSVVDFITTLRIAVYLIVEGISRLLVLLLLTLFGFVLPLVLRLPNRLVLVSLGVIIARL